MYSQSKFIGNTDMRHRFQELNCFQIFIYFFDLYLTLDIRYAALSFCPKLIILTTIQNAKIYVQVSYDD